MGQAVWENQPPAVRRFAGCPEAGRGKHAYACHALGQVDGMNMRPRTFKYRGLFPVDTEQKLSQPLTPTQMLSTKDWI